MKCGGTSGTPVKTERSILPRSRRIASRVNPNAHTQTHTHTTHTPHTRDTHTPTHTHTHTHTHERKLEPHVHVQGAAHVSATTPSAALIQSLQVRGSMSADRVTEEQHQHHDTSHTVRQHCTRRFGVDNATMEACQSQRNNMVMSLLTTRCSLTVRREARQ
jgi:hypothetical protein